MGTTSYRIGARIALKTFSDGLSRLSSLVLLLLAARLLAPVEFGWFWLAWATGWVLCIAWILICDGFLVDTCPGCEGGSLSPAPEPA